MTEVSRELAETQPEHDPAETPEPIRLSVADALEDRSEGAGQGGAAVDGAGDSDVTAGAGTGAVNRAPVRAKRRHRPVRFIWLHAAWSCFVGVFVLLVMIVGLMAVMGRTLEAPSWVRTQLQTRIDAALDGKMLFAFGEIALAAGDDWLPRIRLRDLVLSQPDGVEVLRLADAEVGFSIPALMQGQMRPNKVLVTGVFATLRMDRDGAVALTMGDAAAPVGEAQTMAHLMESWDEALEEPILSRLSVFEIQSLTLRYENARAGRAWTVDGGQVLARRKGQDLRLSGVFSLLSGRDYASAVQMNYSSRIGDLAAEFGFSVTDIAAEDVAAQTVALNWMEVLRAPISGGFRGEVLEDGSLGPVSASLQIGPGVLQPTDSTRPIPFVHAGTYLTYTPAEQKLVFDQVSLQSPWASGVAEGSAYLNGVEDGRLHDLVGQVRLRDVRVNPAGLYDETMAMSEASADFRLELDPFLLTLGELQISDGPSTFLTSGRLAAEPDGWSVALDAHVNQIQADRLLQIWPQQAVVKPRAWVEENLLRGTLSDVDFALRTQPGAAPDLYLDFDFADTAITVTKWLPPLTGARGTASLMKDRFAVTAFEGSMDSGDHGVLDAAGTSFVIANTKIKPDTPAQVQLQAEGPAAAVLALLNRPPLAVLKNTTLPVDMAGGTVRATGTLDWPLKKGLKFTETDFRVSGVIEGVESTILVPGHRITAESLAIEVDNTHVSLTGPAEISGIPVVAQWFQPIGEGPPKPGRLAGEIELSGAGVEAFKIGLPPGSVRGAGPAEFVIDLVPGQAPVMRMSSTLEGVALSIGSLGWSKPASASGKLEMRVVLGDQPQVESLTLNAAGLSAQGRITTRSDGGLDRASFSSVRLGNWLNTPVDIVGRGPNVPVGLEIRGGSLDMPRATFGDSEGESGPVNVSLQKLKITDSIYLTDFKGKFSGGAGLAGPFSGLLGGRTPVTGRVVPSEGRSAFVVEASDAGGVLRDAGLLTQARSGTFTMTLKPVVGAGTYDGSARIRNLRVTDAPAVAALLDAASIVGLLDELAGSGILFGDVQARFRLTPEQMILYQGSAEGPSMGLSMDGVYDIDADRLRMQGVFSPLYLINSIGSLLTRKGEGLIGLSYTLGGQASDPQVQVNPLSALTPGMLREVLRKPPPKDPNEPERGSARTSPHSQDLKDGAMGGR